MTKLASASKLAAVIVLSFGTLAVTGCTADAGGGPEDDASEALGTTTQALDNGTVSVGYSCTDAGFCQCKGLTDCNSMFLVCKSHVYCNQDAQGLRCSCLN